MPELPEVETTVAGLRPVLEGQRLIRVEPRRADLRWPIPVDIRQRMTGAVVTGLSRRAKYGLIDTDRGDTLIFHLGMSGRWRIDPQVIEKHDHFVLETEEGRVLALNDPRRFGSLEVFQTVSLGEFAPFAAMGPEPLGPELTGAYLKAATAGRASPIKLLLLNQKIVAGLGNIYVCEALNMARISPRRKGANISLARFDVLVRAIKEVLTAAIKAGGSSLKDFVQPDGELGYFAKDWRVYGREGEPCPCGGTVQRRVDSGRSTFFCPTCQN